MEDPLRITRELAIPLRELEVRASRSSGPGGQHANVTASRIEVSFDVGGSATLTDQQKALVRARLGDRVTATAQDSRSQARNRELAMERLRARLAAALRPVRPRQATRPSAAAERRRRDAKRRIAALKRSRRPSLGDDD